MLMAQKSIIHPGNGPIPIQVFCLYCDMQLCKKKIFFFSLRGTAARHKIKTPHLLVAEWHPRHQHSCSLRSLTFHWTSWGNSILCFVWCYGNYCCLAIVLWCGYYLLFLVLHHLKIAPNATPRNFHSSQSP